MERKTILHDEIGKCELCGLISVVQIHHKKPLALGGTNDTDNLICICESCHKEIHKGSKSDLVKAGIEKGRHEPREPLVSWIELTTSILNLITDTECDSIPKHEIYDLIFSLEIRKRRKPTASYDLILEEYKKAWDCLEDYLKER